MADSKSAISPKQWFLISSWALYDLANQFFAINIVSLYFVRWLTIEKKAPEVLYGAAFGFSIFLVALSAPLAGEISDITGRRKPFLIILTLAAAIFTAALGAMGRIWTGIIFFVIANFACQAAVIFYNGLMANVTPPGREGLVSGAAGMLSYAGTLLALYVSKLIVAEGGYPAIFFLSGLLFLVFSLPCLVFVKDADPVKDLKPRNLRLKIIYEKVKNNFVEIAAMPSIGRFFRGSFFGLCAVNAVILFMSVYVFRVFALGDAPMARLVFFSTLSAIFGSVASGYFSDRIGILSGIRLVYILWALAITAGAAAANIAFLYLAGALTGFSLGSTWVLLRAFAIRIVPAQKLGVIFGLFYLVGSLAAVTGALFWSGIIFFLSKLGPAGYRIALFSLNLFVAAGFLFFLKMKEPVERAR